MSDLAKTAIVFALKPALFLLSSVTIGTFLLFTFRVKDSTQLREKKVSGGVKNRILQVAITGTQAKLCVLQNLSSHLSHNLLIPHKVDGGLGRYFLVHAL